MLPVSDIYPDLLNALQQHPVVLLQAPPGAGKSTWLPLQLIRDHHFNHIVMLEPRRLAARNIAAYLAHCQNESVGESIGLRIRQEKRISAATKLEIVTEGMLTRLLQADPELAGIDCLIFDEFHERSLHADTALAFALEIQATLRDDLKILIMSATLESDRMAAQLGCPVIQSHGRSFPVREMYQPLYDEKNWLAAMAPLITKAMQEQSGNCLVFLPGQREITTVQQNLHGLPPDIDVYTLFGEQQKDQQQAAIAPAKNGRRKVVLATNVAETSLTIEGIRIVVDGGKRRHAQFNLNTGVTELKTVNISMASAIQRAGRAGRTEPGVVYRLGSEEQCKRREAQDAPAILTTDISGLMLKAALWGTAINELALLNQPTVAQQQQAQALLHMLEAVDTDGKITAIGKALLTTGTDLRWSHMLYKAQHMNPDYPGLYNTAIMLLSLLESRVNREPELVHALQAQLHKPHPLFRQQQHYWQKRLPGLDKQATDTQYLPLLLALAYPDRIARRRGHGFLMANGAGVDSRDDCWPKADYLCIAELGGSSGKHIFSATAADITQLQQALPHLFSQQTVCEFDERSGRFINEQRLQLGAIILSAKPVEGGISPALRNNAWLALIRKHGFKLFDDWTNHQTERDNNPCVQYQLRLELAHRFFPQQFPPADEQHLLDKADLWLAPFLHTISNVAQLKKLNLLQALQAIPDWQQQQTLNTLLPERIAVPSGSAIRIRYQQQGPARLAVRMQEVFGLSATPALAQGKLPLLMDLLSPAQRSLQLTQDLAGFWQSSYKEVQKEMKGRYPKHYWPDDPASAQATTKVKNRM